MKKSIIAILAFNSIILLSCQPKWEKANKEDFILVQNSGGKQLGLSLNSDLKLIIQNRFAFKDLNKNNKLDKYEDWRLSPEIRAQDLASQMSIEEISGLMLYSPHQAIPSAGGRRGGTYDKKPFKESGFPESAISDQQKEFLIKDDLRHVLITRVSSPEVAAKWNNSVQSLIEGIGLGIPANNSSDPRHGAAAEEEYVLGAGGKISQWPGSLGLAASFDPGLVKKFGEIASIEYRALGIATALSPQIDIASDPRWYRFGGTFGISPDLTTDMARAYVDGFQTTSFKDRTFGWGLESVNAMVKHWPGGGTGEGGRDAHYGFGKYGVFPGKNIEMHMKPFIEGAFKLSGGTDMAAAVMPYYTISYGQDPSGENVGNAYSKYLITDKLRNENQFDGVVCTDWGVTKNEEGISVFGKTPWGVEHLTETERHYKLLMSGVDQFGGNNDAGPIISAFEMGVKEKGEDFMRKRFEISAVRLLKNIFRVGLFENPYLEIKKTKQIVGNVDFMKEGYNAQLKSVVLLKNKENVLPLKANQKVYIPKRYFPPKAGFFGPSTKGEWKSPINRAIASKYFNLVDTPEEAEVALVYVESPDNGRTAGYDPKDLKNGGNGFLPISLQYEGYIAKKARNPSLAGDKRPNDILNRSYKNKSVIAKNKSDLELIRTTLKEMKGKPLVVLLRLSNPMVVKEFENKVDAIVLNFKIQDQALFEVISGIYEPTGLLPLQIPANMETVEQQLEDLPFDLESHIDSKGNAYDFGYGLNWKGVIQDNRNKKYKKY